MPETLMHLRLLVPSRVFADLPGVSRIVAETSAGSFGLLPHRLDCVAALTPGILTYQAAGEAEVFVAVDDGVLVKTGSDVFVSVRRAVGGADLGSLRDVVQKQFVTLSDDEQGQRQAIARMETELLRRLSELHHA